MPSSSSRFPVSDHCDGRKFFNPRRHRDHPWHEVLWWKLTSRAVPWPAQVEVTPRLPPPAPRDGTLTATWINHASFLLQTRHGHLLIDPVYSDRVSPFGWTGPRRVHPPGVRFEDLPAVAAVLVSHDHYDHCDLPTLARLAARSPQPLAIAPLGNGGLMRGAGFAAANVVELDWWDAHELGDGFHVRLTPARHWSNRVRGLRNRRLWGGFFIQAGGRTAHFVGDTGYDETMFRDIRIRCGAPDLALIPIGAYEPRWFMAGAHCNPAEAVQIHRELGARLSVGMHWGTFPLTDEGREAPVQALAESLARAGVPPAAFRVLAPGESVAT